MKGAIRMALTIAGMMGYQPAAPVAVPKKKKHINVAPDDYDDDPSPTKKLNSTTWFSKRNGAKECARRIKQGINGTCYVHGCQYPGGLMR